MKIKSTTEVTLPFGIVIMERETERLFGDRTTWRYAFGDDLIDWCDPLDWNGKENRNYLRDLMVSEGGATLEEADQYIRVLVGKQWNRRKGNHNMTIEKGQTY
jgi:hypothetical protein